MYPLWMCSMILKSIAYNSNYFNLNSLFNSVLLLFIYCTNIYSLVWKTNWFKQHELKVPNALQVDSYCRYTIEFQNWEIIFCTWFDLMIWSKHHESIWLWTSTFQKVDWYFISAGIVESLFINLSHLKLSFHFRWIRLKQISISQWIFGQLHWLPILISKM